ncbi:MAG: radical SAM protein [Chloroflexota bacterium]
MALNGLSGAVDLLDDSTKEILDAPDSAAIAQRDPDVVSGLRRRGYLFSNQEEEDRLLLAMWERQTQRIRERPLTFALCPTHSCNLACRYCFEGPITSRAPRVLEDLDIEAAFRAMDAIGSGHPSRRREVDLFGGEPLLPSTRQAVRKILQEAEARGMGVGVVTNGTNVAGFRDLLVEYRQLFSHFQITVDGPEAVHDGRRPFRSGRGSYQLAMEGVGLLVSLGLRVALRVNLDAENIGHLPALAEAVEERGWTEKGNFRCVLAPVADHLASGSYSPLLPEEQLVRELAAVMAGSEAARRLFRMDLFRSAKHLSSVLGLTSTRAQPMFQYCEANGLHSYTFGADGYIYPCSEMLDQPDLAIGSFSPSLEMDEEKATPWRERSILLMPRCRNCRVATFCGGGCAYQALKASGSLSEPACYGAERVIAAFLDCFADRLSPQ